MFENEDVAAIVNLKLNDVYRVLEGTIGNVNEGCSAEEAVAYREVVSKLFAILVFEMMEPLYRKHPELKPADWDD